jgi:hypothetical protein
MLNSKRQREREILNSLINQFLHEESQSRGTHNTTQSVCHKKKKKKKKKLFNKKKFRDGTTWMQDG